MEQQFDDQKSEDKTETSKAGIMENLNYAVSAKSAEQQQTNNQKTEDLTSNGEKANKTYITDSDNLEQHTSFISTETPTILDKQLISVCSCLLSDQSFNSETDTHKRKLTNDQIAKTYLRVRRIPELIRFILTKILSSKPQNVASYIEELLDDCMCFRAGHGKAPVLYEERHLEAVIKSFDPGDRGWLSAGQVRRAYTTIGLTPKSDLEVRTPTKEVLQLLRKTQERELLSLISAGMEEDEICAGNI